MAKLEEHQSSKTTKLLLIGDSGAGKSGSLASLAAAGYNLRILDVDNGIDVLANYLRDKTGPYGPEALDRVEFETITDPMKNVNGKLIPRQATVWQRTMKLLDDWSPKNGASADLGPISKWTENDVLVIDSLTMLSNAALNFILAMNARIGQKPHQSDWYDGQLLLEGLLQMLYDDGIVCNVIITAHIVFLGEENGPQRGYPNSLGSKFPPKIGRYFNTILMAKTTGQGTALHRKILTNTAGLVELKNTAPLKVKPEYPLATGLADYFKDVRG